MDHSASNPRGLAALALSILLSLTAAAERPAGTQEADAEADAQKSVEMDLETAIRRGTVQRVPVQEKGVFGAARHQPTIERALDDKDDPPGLLAESGLGNLKELAARLSIDRSWLRPEILRGLELQDLRLDEVFVHAPEAVRLGQDLYRIQLERVGSGWEGFDPDNAPYIVFLSQEVFDGWGDDRALGFRDGLEMPIFESDLEEQAALAVTLVEIHPADPVAGGAVSSLDASLELGSAQLRLPRHRLPLELLPEVPGVDLGALVGASQGLESVTAASTCTQEVASSGCSSGRPVCPTGYLPYFVLDQLLIKTDHEGALKGNSEIELFPLRIDVVSPPGSTATAQTTLWFYGQYVTDMAGRSRYLPDVNNTWSWYTVTNGLALFPLDRGFEFSALLVEQDDDRGVLRVHPTKINITKLWKSVQQVINDIRTMDDNFLFSIGKLLLNIIAIFNDGDDIYQESIGVANNLFCTDSPGQKKTYFFDTQEWQMKGHFSCINPSCPDPSSGGGGTGPIYPDTCLMNEPGVVCP
ncbi:MAG TPA: hypothetical protein VHQ65_14525 [Thermoanaerobaculia bacterium]|nr:hypothetical protein [Thermoanaerobaculia bacterium]